MYKLSAIAIPAALLLACGQPESVVISEEDTESDFASEDERTLYALGIAVGENVAESVSVFSLSDAERALMLEGLRDAVYTETYRVDMDIYGPLINELADRRIAAAAETEQAAAEGFADSIAAEEGAERMASGLIYVPVTPADGAMPEATDTVRVHYHGTLRDGTVFDSSRERGMPAEFGLNQVIACWTEGLQLMQVGETAQLLCPSNIAYGPAGRPPTIPGGAALLFEVELLEIIE